MRLLLDTHVLLWVSEESARLSEEAKALIEDPENVLVFSVVSLWEIAVKRRGKDASFRTDPHVLRRQLIDHGYVELAITGAHALAVDLLPPIHKDPFDRMLAAQALAEGILLITADRMLARYPCPSRLV
jgi:PIN domain nuclease of toxin-antitoxin system